MKSSIHEKDNLNVQSSEVKRFHTSLVIHTQNTLGLNLDAVPLLMYKTPDFELYAEGKVRTICLE